MRNPYRDFIEIAAEAEAFDVNVLDALVQIESGGRADAARYEPAYCWVWNVVTAAPFRTLNDDEVHAVEPPPDFPAFVGTPLEEWTGQRTSLGLCQIMGAVLRERGYRGEFDLLLREPLLNLQLGAKLLRELLDWAGETGGDLRKALAAYNAGRGGWESPAGQAYASRVLARRAQIQRGLA